MDTLFTIALFVFAIAAVAGIIFFNKWQEARHRTRADLAFPKQLPDPLLDREDPVERVEPGIGGDEIETLVENAETGALPGYRPKQRPAQGSVQKPEQKPEQKPARKTPVAPVTRRAHPPLPDRLDSRVDCCVQIEAFEPIKVSRLWGAQVEVFEGLGRTLRWYAFDDRENQWRRVNGNTEGAYHWFLSAMQLVDRSGPISEAVFLRYVRGIQALSDRIHAVPASLPSRSDVMNNAKALDHFCAEVDVLIAINVAAKSPMPASHIVRLAEAEGMRLEGDGTFHARANDSRTLYVLANGEASSFTRGNLATLKTHHLSLVLDLPRVADASAEFEDMLRFATHLAKALGGVVVDDNGRPFGAEAVDAIRARVRAYQQRMKEQGIIPGGSLARRLFGT